MKKRTVGELQAMRAAWRFMLGLGAFAIVLTAWLLLFLYPNLTPEQKESPVHKNDLTEGTIIGVVSIIAIIGGWKLRAYVKKCEQESGQSSKPFGRLP